MALVLYYYISFSIKVVTVMCCHARLGVTLQCACGVLLIKDSDNFVNNKLIKESSKGYIC